MHAYNVFEFIQAVMTSATSTNLDIGRSNDADEGLQTLLEQLVNGLEVHNAIVWKCQNFSSINLTQGLSRIKYV